MHLIFYQFSFLVVSIAGRMNQHQQQVIEHLMEENRVLRNRLAHGEWDFETISDVDSQQKRRNSAGNY